MDWGRGMSAAEYKEDDVLLLTVQLATATPDSDGEFEVTSLPRGRVTYAHREVFVSEPPSWSRGARGTIRVRVVYDGPDGDGDVRVEIDGGTRQVLYVQPQELEPIVNAPLDTVDDIERFLEE